MVEGADSARSAKKPAGLSIQLPPDEEEEKKATPAADTSVDAGPGKVPSSSGRTSARGEGRTSARGDGGTSGRTSARKGGLSARGNAPVKSVFCHEAVIKGNVIFGDGCIVHPGAQILAEGGDIILGDYNIVEEYARIVNQPRKD